MQPSINFFNFLAHEEGLKLVPYLDAAGHPTIGYGSTYYPNGKAVTMEDPAITQEKALEIAQFNVKAFVAKLNQLAPYVNQNQFDALLDFEYNLGWGNLGASTLLKKVNAGAPDETIKECFLMWDEVRENGVLKKNEWQVERRLAEYELYIKPVA